MTDEEFEIIKNSIKTMTPEKIKRDILCLNGKITKEIVETVLNQKFFELGVYCAMKMLIIGIWTPEEGFFRFISNYIDKNMIHYKVDCYKEVFEEYKHAFSYNNKKENFAVSIIIGQGIIFVF